jgi:hypothetical protein
MTFRAIPTLAVVDVSILHVILKENLPVTCARPEDQPAPAPRLEQGRVFIANATLDFFLLTHGAGLRYRKIRKLHEVTVTGFTNRAYFVLFCE